MGISSGRNTASAVATPPIVPAVARIAPVLTPNADGSDAASLPSGRPHRATCSLSCRNSINRNPPAVAAKIHQETPPSRMLTGTL